MNVLGGLLQTVDHINNILLRLQVFLEVDEKLNSIAKLFTLSCVERLNFHGSPVSVPQGRAKVSCQLQPDLTQALKLFVDVGEFIFL